MSEPSTGRMEDLDEDSISLSSATNKTQDSVEKLVIRMKFARETAMLTMPTWQSAAHHYAQSILKIFDQIISVLTLASDHLTIGSLNSEGSMQSRLTPMVYFAGLLINNFHPGASEVNGTFDRMDVFFISIENETIKLIKTMKKFEIGLLSFTKSLSDEFSHPTYRTFPNNGKNENESNVYDRSMFKTFSLHNFPGVWLELTNLEREALNLQCQDVTRNGEMIKISADDLQLEVAIKLASLLLAEIHETVQKASMELAELELTNELLKGWKKASKEFVNYLKLIRKVHEFTYHNCATDLYNVLTEICWKMDLVIHNRVKILKTVCIWILKGVECVRRKTRNWAPDHVVITTPQVKKYIKTPRPVISKFLRCFQSRPKKGSIDFVKMFLDIGNVVGESFLLEVAISRTMKDILFAGYMVGRSEDTSDESLRAREVEAVVEGASESERRNIVDLEKSDDDIGEEVVTAKLNSTDAGSRDHTPVSEQISRKNSPFELEMHAISERGSDSEEFPAANVEEKITLTGAGFDEDGESISSNHFQESLYEIPGKSNDTWIPSEENRVGDPLNSPELSDGSKSVTTGDQPPRKFRFYWARRLIERMSKPK